jgi:hypothetical protein
MTRLKRSQIERYESQMYLINLLTLLLKDSTFGTRLQRRELKLRLKGAQRWLTKLQNSETDEVISVVGDVVVTKDVHIFYGKILRQWYISKSFNLELFLVNRQKANAKNWR